MDYSLSSSRLVELLQHGREISEGTHIVKNIAPNQFAKRLGCLHTDLYHPVCCMDKKHECSDGADGGVVGKEFRCNHGIDVSVYDV